VTYLPPKTREAPPRTASPSVVGLCATALKVFERRVTESVDEGMMSTSVTTPGKTVIPGN